VLCVVSGSGSAQGRKPDAEHLFRQAQYADRVQKDYPRAIKLCKESLRLAPDNTDPRELLGRLYLRTGEFQLARIELKRVIARFPSNTDVLMNLVNLETAEGNFAEAIGYCDQYLKIQTANREVLFRKTGLYARQQRYEEAMALAGKLLESSLANPEYRAAFVEYAIPACAGRLAHDDVDGAYRLADRARVVDASNADLSALLLNIYYRKGLKDSALVMCEQLLRNTPMDSTLMVKRASLLQENGRPVEAMAASSEVLARFPDNLHAATMYHDLLMDTYRDTINAGNFSAGRVLLQEGLAVLPGDLRLQASLSLLNNRLGNYDAAVLYADQVLKVTPEDSLMLLNKTIALQSARRYREAAVSADKLVRLYPDQKTFRDLYDQVSLRKYRNQLAVGYLYSVFTEGIDDASIATVQYFHYFRRASVGFRLNYGQRPAGEGVQAEMESYISHGRKAYSYASAGWSPEIIFPTIRAAYSYFQGFGKGWEWELGGRYLLTDSIHTISAVGSIGKTIHAYWFNIRGFAINDDGKWYQSYILNNRVYFRNQLDYFSFFGSIGSMPDDRSRNFQFNSTLGFLTWSAGIGLQKRIHPAHAILANATWTRQKTGETTAYNQYDLSVTYQLFF
jgi:YaiO family outer membrane protein